MRTSQEAQSQTMPSLQALAQMQHSVPLQQHIHELQHAIQGEQQLKKGVAAPVLEGKAAGKDKTLEDFWASGH